MQRYVYTTKLWCVRSRATDDIKVSGKNKRLPAFLRYADTTGIVNDVLFAQNTTALNAQTN